MIDNNTELAEMISTRISHDLIGNIGALSSALELIKENNNELDEDTRSIIDTAVGTLKARQTFFRIAFGLDTKNIETEELNNICRAYLETLGSRTYPITLQLSGISVSLAKFLCLSVMVGAEVCIRGGEINVAVNQNNMTICVTSDHSLSASKIDVYKNILHGVRPQDNISQYVQLIYLRELLGTDVSMKINSSDTSMELIIG
ncbi:MAG: hypothetical protein IJ677_07235 [Alphaproteobacteria bacterium]|nr:hypothetical protein [Alphaproteobacteria bacterium]